jgi:hypothetical protein
LSISAVLPSRLFRASRYRLDDLYLHESIEPILAGLDALGSNRFSASMPCRMNGQRGQGLFIIKIVSSDYTFMFNPPTI